MSGTVTPVTLGVSLLPIVASVVLLGLVWRQREHVAARLLFGVGAGMCLGSVLHLVFVQLFPDWLANLAPHVTATDWPLVVFPVSALAGGIWLLFAFRYTGRGRVVFRVTAAGVLGLAVVAFATVGLYLDGAVSRTLATDVLSFIIFVVSLLTAVGAFLLVGVSVGQNAFPSREPLFFAGGAVALMAGVSIASVFASTLVYAGSLTLSGLLFGRAAVRTAAFETLPAARVIGRDQVIEELADAAVVVDRDRRVRDLNAAAETLFETSRESAVGASVEELLPETTPRLDALAAEETTRVETTGRTFAVRTDRITGRRADTLGYLLLWSDITEQRRREQRLTVLNRFLVTTLREQTERIHADAVSIARVPDARGHDIDSSRTADRIWQTTSSLIRIVSDARTLERALADDRTRADERIELTSAARDVLETLTDDRAAGVSVRLAGPDGEASTAASEPLVEGLLRNVLDDALRQAVSRVTVDVSSPATVTVTDDRPHDAQASDPAHSLVIARLAAESLDATLSVEQTDTGRRVAVEFSRRPDAPTDRPIDRPTLERSHTDHR